MVFKELQQFYMQNKNDDKASFDNKIIKSKLKNYGVKTELLRKKAKELSINNAFLHIPRNESYESEFIIGVAMAYSKNSLKDKLNFYRGFFKSVDNWAIVDSVATSLKLNESDYACAFSFIRKNVSKKDIFLARFAYVLFLTNFVNEKHLSDLFSLIDENRPYYILMAEAWLLSVSYVKYPIDTFAFLESLDNKKDLLKLTIRKVLDSYRVNQKDKDLIVTLRG